MLGEAVLRARTKKRSPQQPETRFALSGTNLAPIGATICLHEVGAIFWPLGTHEGRGSLLEAMCDSIRRRTYHVERISYLAPPFRALSNRAFQLHNEVV